MDNFKRNGKRGGDRGFNRGPVIMHSAICSSCKKACEVPFRPTGEKPVYCRDCFAGRAALGGERSERKDFRNDRRSDRRNDNRNGDFQARNISQNIPVHTGTNVNDGIKRQLDEINSKINRLINAVDAFTNKNIQTVSQNMLKTVTDSKELNDKGVSEKEKTESKENKTTPKIVEKMKIKKIGKKK